MGTERTSNKDIASKLDTLIDLMTANAMAEKAPPVLTDKVSDTTEGSEVVIDESYLAHVKPKVQAAANTHNIEYILYARKNKRGENKLAYAQRSRYDDVVSKQPSCLGAIESFLPSS